MHPRPSPSAHRGSRAARRAKRRKGRGWRVATFVSIGVLVCVGAAVAAAALLNDNAKSERTGRQSASRLETQPVSGNSTTTTTGVAALPCRSALTADAPLRLWIAGDSIAWSVGNGLGTVAANTGVVAPVYESRVSSGLSSAGFFDWPKRVGEEIPRLNPEVVVFVMGTNDWTTPQATPVDTSGQPAWKAKYEAQVQGLVDALARDGRTLYWVGPPVLRDAKQEAGTKQVAEVIKSVVDRAPAAEYFDLHDLLDADDGTYTQTAEVDGRKIFVRAGDGIHLTLDGGDFVGEALFKKIDNQCRLKAQAVAGSKQTVVETKGSTTVPGGTSSGSSSTVTTAPSATVAPTTPATTPPTTSATTPPTTAQPTPTGTTPPATAK